MYFDGIGIQPLRPLRLRYHSAQVWYEVVLSQRKTTLPDFKSLQPLKGQLQPLSGPMGLQALIKGYYTDLIPTLRLSFSIQNDLVSTEQLIGSSI